MTNLERGVASRVRERWEGLAAPIAAGHDLDPTLVLAVACQESHGEEVTWRPEPAFLAENRNGIAALVAQLKEPRYARWWRDDPMIFCCSIGIMQTIVTVALERGLSLDYPTDLCKPRVSFEAGCRHLRWCIDRYKGNVEAGIRRYNGGNDYPPKVLRWKAILEEIGGAG